MITRFSVLLLVTLLIFPPALSAKNSGKGSPLEWYVKTRLEVINPTTGDPIGDSRSGIFGQLAESSAGYDRHDVPSFAAGYNSPAAIVFIHGDDWGERAGDYLSDYRAAGNSKEEWAFTVYSTLQPGQATLSWDGLFELTGRQVNATTLYTETRVPAHKQLKKLHLVDLETGEVIDVYNKKGKDQQWVTSYEFDMSGATRRDFRWVLGKVKSSHLEPLDAQNSSLAVEKQTKSKSSLRASQVRSAKATRPKNGKAQPAPGDEQ